MATSLQCDGLFWVVLYTEDMEAWTPWLISEEGRWACRPSYRPLDMVSECLRVISWLPKFNVAVLGYVGK